MMNYKRTWNDSRNAIGFAAACARLALLQYEGGYRSDIATAIEIAERTANGENIEVAISAASAYSTGSAAKSIGFTNATLGAANNAVQAAKAIDAFHPDNVAGLNAPGAAVMTEYIVDQANYAAAQAAQAGVDDSEIRIAYARWTVRDLVYGRELTEELRQAVGAAILAGDEDLARELLR